MQAIRDYLGTITREGRVARGDDKYVYGIKDLYDDDNLGSILAYHIAPEVLKQADFKDGQVIEMLNNKTITVKRWVDGPQAPCLRWGSFAGAVVGGCACGCSLGCAGRIGLSPAMT